MDRKQIIIDLLKMPIVSSKAVTGITLAKRKDTGKLFILSGQNYEGSTDEDMSDIAISFYKTIYQVDILKQDGSLKDNQYAGDTMNSYKQITSRKLCPDEKKEKWFNAYHCLANFWILPMEVGRKFDNKFSKRRISKDYMDGFLKVLNERFDEFKKHYPIFFKDMENIHDFCKVTQIGNIYMDSNNESIKIKTITGLAPKESITVMESLLDLRADYLYDEFSQELFKLFSDCGLICDTTGDTIDQTGSD